MNPLVTAGFAIHRGPGNLQRTMSTDSSSLSRTPEPPYYAVIFTSQRTDGDPGYDAMARRMVELASVQPGFLGVESARGADGFGITVSYWSTHESIAAWKANAEHRAAQETGKRSWYAAYQIRIARVERTYDGSLQGQTTS